MSKPSLVLLFTVSCLFLGGALRSVEAGTVVPDARSLEYPVLQIDTSKYQPVAMTGTERFQELNSAWSGPQEILRGFQNLYNGKIVSDEADVAYPYKMWFFGWAATDCNRGVASQGCDAVFFARSKNMLRWEVYSGKDRKGSPLFDATQNPKKWVPVIVARDVFFDQWHNGDPSVQKVGDTYFMAYSITGFDLDGIPDGTQGDRDKDFSAIGGAISKNGIDWIRSERPLLVSRQEPGKIEPQPDGLYHRPSLLIEGNRVRIWFDYWAADGGLSMGMAELQGPVSHENFLRGRWVVRQGGNAPAIRNFPNPSVVKLDGLYYAYADPVGYSEGWGGRQTVEAVSNDGLNWQITGYLKPPANGKCADHQVPEASVLHGQIYITTACHYRNAGDDFRYRSMSLWKKKKIAR